MLEINSALFKESKEVIFT